MFSWNANSEHWSLLRWWLAFCANDHRNLVERENPCFLYCYAHWSVWITSTRDVSCFSSRSPWPVQILILNHIISWSHGAWVVCRAVTLYSHKLHFNTHWDVINPCDEHLFNHCTLFPESQLWFFQNDPWVFAPAILILYDFLKQLLIPKWKKSHFLEQADFSSPETSWFLPYRN